MNIIQLEYLKSIILGQLLLEANDNLKTTTQYRQSLKNRINSLNKDLESIVSEEYVKMHKSEPEMLLNIERKIESLVHKLATKTIDELVMLESIIEKYETNKEWFLEYAESEFLRID